MDTPPKPDTALQERAAVTPEDVPEMRHEITPEGGFVVTHDFGDKGRRQWAGDASQLAPHAPQFEPAMRPGDRDAYRDAIREFERELAKRSE